MVELRWFGINAGAKPSWEADPLLRFESARKMNGLDRNKANQENTALQGEEQEIFLEGRELRENERGTVEIPDSHGRPGIIGAKPTWIKAPMAGGRYSLPPWKKTGEKGNPLPAR
jgi:hypothetical protein